MSEHNVGHNNGKGASVVIPGDGSAVPYLETFVNSYNVDQHTKKDEIDARQARIHSRVGSIEDLVKDALVTKDKEGNVVSDPNAQATEAQSRLIAGKVIYELARALDQYKGSPDGIDEKKANELLNRAASAIQDPSVSSVPDLVTAIMNMATSNPKSHKYDRNSAFARLLTYIGTQYDEGSKEIQHAQNMLRKAWTHPDVGVALNHELSARTGIPLNPTATFDEASREYVQQQTAKSQYVQTMLKKTYTSNGHGGAHDGKLHPAPQHEGH